jgi:hypothetical protein
LPPESRPAHHVAVPQSALNTVRITLQRGACMGPCPVYSVEIRGDGTARYKGDGAVVVHGEHTFQISPETARCLVEDFRAADFWSLAPAYVDDNISDFPDALVTLEIGGQKKSLEDYLGRLVGMPASVTALEELIDRTAAHRWTHGDADTIPSLRAEHFDFHSPQAGPMLAKAAEVSPDEVVLGLLAEGAPATGRLHGWPREGEDGPSAVELASGRGDIVTVRALIAAGAFAGSQRGVKEPALAAGAGASSPAVVAEILKYGPDVNARDRDGVTALMHTGRGYSPHDKAADFTARKTEILRLLLAAGADPRLVDKDGTTSLFYVSGAEAVALLLKAGVKVEARDGLGDTPLLAAGDDDAAMALIEAGADTTAVNDAGVTLLSLATERNWPRTLAWLRTHGAAT